MRYRTPEERLWREGRTENISRSGVLFHTDYVMPMEAQIEMLLALPAEIGGGENPTVVCRGRVVRVETAEPGGKPVVAATIAGYRLTHDLESDPRRI
jgi:hypothetical protein